MKSHFSHKFFSLLILSLALSLSVSHLHAQEPKIIYVYDDLGRLVRVVNQNNECATYEYDAVGNILSITRSTDCLQPPTIASLSQDSAQTDDTTCITITGSNFLGATVTTDNPDVQISRVRVSETSIAMCLTISQFAAVGTTNITVSTTVGMAVRTLTINAKVIVITQDSAIGPTDRSLDAAALTIQGPVTVTIDGTHRFNSLTLQNSAVVTHSAASNLDLRVDTALTIDSTSRIDVSGRGFLGGRQPGNPFGVQGMTIGFQVGSSAFAGGSYGGLGGGASNPVYGDFRDANEPGSGGAAPNQSQFIGGEGGNGGGLVRIVAQTLNLDGTVKSDGGGGSSVGGGGSGGGIRIDVGTLRGAGQITANGGHGNYIASGGGGGRIAIYYQDATGFDFNRVNALGGTTDLGSTGGAGTAYLQGPGRESGELIVDNNNVAAPSLSTPLIPPGLISLTHFRVRRGASVKVDDRFNLTNIPTEISFGAELGLAGTAATLNIPVDVHDGGILTFANGVATISTINASSNSTINFASGRLIAATVNLTNGSLITHTPTNASTLFKVDLSANALDVDSTSRIDVSGRGFLGGRQPGNPFGVQGMTIGFQVGSSAFAGGSYGGLGGGASNPVYGDFRDANEPGSGGAAPNQSQFIGGEGGNGGGLVRIVAQTLNLDGTVKSDGGGGSSVGGGGSGGGIRIDVGTLRGAGQITANGGHGNFVASGGGGGRIAIYYQDATGFNLTRVNALGGTADLGSSGGAGTVHLQQQTFTGWFLPDSEVPIRKATAERNHASQLASLSFIPLGAMLELTERTQVFTSPAGTSDFIELIAKMQGEMPHVPQRRVFSFPSTR